MKKNAKASRQVQAFFRAWFCRRDPAGAAAYLTEDVNFVSTAHGGALQGHRAMLAYLQTDCREKAEPFRLSFLHPQELPLGTGAATVVLELILQNERYSWHLRASLSLRLEADDWRICQLHISQATGGEKDDEHYPDALILKNLRHQQEEVFNNAVAGGVMGCYIKPNFPFYFINRQMLRYLGYATQEEFVAEIGGLVASCIHPDDRALMEEQVDTQLAIGAEYTVEYRMRKKGGDYIWVRDVGRAVTAENGKPAIIFACIDISDLRQSQEARRQLLNAMPGAVVKCRCAKGLEVLETSVGLFDIIGYSCEEFKAMGNQLATILLPGDAAAILPSFEAQESAGMGAVYIEFRLSHRDGHIAWISMRGQLFFEDSGEKVLVGIITDASAQVEERQRIHAQYEREMEYATELTAPNLIAKARANLTENTFEAYAGFGGRTKEMQFTSASVDNAICRIAESAVSQEDCAAINTLFSRWSLLRGYAEGEANQSYTFRRRWSGEKTIWCKTVGRTYLNPQTNQLELFMYSFDVTQTELGQKMLERASVLGYDLLVDVDINNDSFQMISSSPEFDEMSTMNSFQQEIQKVLEHSILEPFRTELLRNLQYDTIRARLEQDTMYSFNAPVRVDGQMRYKKCSVYYIDEILGHVCIARTDITDIILQEQRQRESLLAALQAAEQANTAKTDFLSHMSHEIRTPLNAIIGMAAIASSSVGNDAEIANCLSKIGISSRFLLTLINDILDMSRIERGKMQLKSERFSLEHLVRTTNNIVRPQAEQKDVDFDCVIRPGLTDSYVGDQMKLQQVLVNILSNAIKFTDSGGKVTFSVAQVFRGKETIDLRFTIADNGIGVSPEFLSHIFDPFAQESRGTTALYGGTGLGLSISKSIVDMMGGQLNVHSMQGVGTEFTIDVKLEAGAQEVRLPPELRYADVRALVVDDDVSVCESVVLTLREIGITGEWVDTGARAVSRVEELMRHRDHFDLILVDLRMPGMDGIQTTRRLRELVGPDVSIIVMTAYDYAEIEQEARTAGVDLLIDKPLFRSTLESALESILDGKPKLLAPTTPPSRTYDFTGRRVLLAEDHPLNTEIAVKLLRRVGFQVDAAANGLLALNIFKESAADYYDAVLMDIRMPMMDGLVASASIRQLSRADAATVPIIAMTANAFEDDVEKSKAAGMNAHLTKPIEPTLLYRTLYDFIFRERGDGA